MSDKDIPSSGSRWEPVDGAPAAPTEPVAATPALPSVDTEHMGHGAIPTGDVRPTRLPGRLRGRSAVAAAGVGLVLAGGLGGFAIGHALTGDDAADNGTVTDQNGVPGDGNGVRPHVRDRDRPAPGGGFPGGTDDPGATSPDSGDGGGTA